jgi:hypothetical protein
MKKMNSNKKTARIVGALILIAYGVLGSFFLESSLIAVTLINMMAGSTVIPFIFSHFPVILNELFLAVWLIFKGFNPSVIKA